MEEHAGQQELKDRLDLIERMIAEGRRNTESWGWAFVLWGVSYFVAMGWSALSHSAWAWPATMFFAVLTTVVVASVRVDYRSETALGRAVGSIWIALGISMFSLFVALGVSGRLTDLHVFMAVMSALLGMANAASALILRWKLQLACAVVWWLAAAATCFGTAQQSTVVFLAAILLCQILFGIHGMITEGRTRKRGGTLHG